MKATHDGLFLCAADGCGSMWLFESGNEGFVEMTSINYCGSESTGLMILDILALNDANSFVLCLQSVIQPEKRETTRFLVEIVEVRLLNSSQSSQCHVLASFDSLAAPHMTKLSLSDDLTVSCFFVINTSCPLECSDDNKQYNAGMSQSISHHIQYEWSQSHDEVVLTMILPLQCRKSDIRVTMKQHYLQVRTLFNQPASVLFGAELFGAIDVSQSMWTIDEAECDGKGNLLTVYLTKKSEGTIWTNLCSQDDSVVERRDGSQVSRLDKLQPESNGVEFKSLSERQEMIDLEGDSVYFKHVTVDLKERRIDGNDVSSLGSNAWLGKVLGSDEQCILKQGIDAVVVSIAPEPVTMTRLNAIGFVQASKRDKKLVTATPDSQYTLIVESNKYIYVYETPKENMVTSRQFVFDVASVMAETGRIAGIQMMCHSICVLCEFCIFTLVLPNNNQ